MRAVPADGVELALKPVGQCINPWCDAGREGLPFEMAQQRRGEHLEGVLEVLRDRLPNPSRRGKGVDEENSILVFGAVALATYRFGHISSWSAN